MLLKLWSLLSPRRRWQLGILLILMVLGSLAEVMSIGAVFPLLAVLTTPSAVFDQPFAKDVLPVLGIQAPHQLLIPAISAFAVATILAAGVRLFVLYVTSRFSQAVGADLSAELYRRTLYRSYAYHLDSNSSELVAAITGKVAILMAGVLLPVLNVVSIGLMIGSVVGALLVIDPVLVVVGTSLVMSVYFLLHVWARRGLDRNAKIISAKTTDVVRILHEGLGGIRDVIIDGTQEAYARIFQEADRPLRSAHARNYFIAASPRFVVEAVGMIAIAGYAYYASQRPGGLEGAIPTLAALALGAQRLLPMIQLGYSSLASIRGARTSVQDVLDLLGQSVPPRHTAIPQDMPFEVAIELRNIVFGYRPDVPVLKGVNLRLEKGRRYGFIGTTGSGKSTLLDVLMGLLDPISGSFEVDGRPIDETTRRAWQRRLAHVPQSIFLSDATIAENIAFGVSRSEIDHLRVKAAAAQAQIAEMVEALPLGYNTSVGERGGRLSGGQRQRIGIARALYKQVDVLILDEATSALDSNTEASVMESIRGLRGGPTVLLVAHRLSTLEGCDEIFEIKGGEVKAIGK